MIEQTDSERETYRGVIHTRQPAGYDGQPCTLLVRRVIGRVQLLHHAVLSSGADLPEELLGHLTAARHAGAARERQR